ncbi:MAG: OprO/OprP family phosphate-selective porin [Planctomycetota bacterium]
MRIFLIVSWLTIGFLTMSLLFEPMKDVSAQDDDLRMQLKKMEEMMKKQQGMINDLKTRIEIREEVEQTSLTAIDEEIIGEKVNEYFQEGEGKGMWTELMKRPKLGYKKGFYFETADKKFSMMMNGRLQMRYGYEDRDNIHDSEEQQDDSSFRIRRARLKWSGKAFEHFKYKIELALASTGTVDGSKAVELYDWWASYNKNPAASIQFGQWKVPWNRQRVVSSQHQQMIDRASAQDEFTMNRQIGAMLHGKLFNKKFEYYAGMFNGNNRNQSSNGNNENLYIARASWNPFGAYGKGIGEKESDLDNLQRPIAHISAAIAFDGAADETIDLKRVGEITAKEVDRTSIVAEYGLKYKGFSTSAEAYWRKYDGIDTSTSDTNPSTKVIDRGFFVQGGYFVVPKKFEVASRYSLVDFDNQRTTDAKRETTVGINWFINGHGHDNKLQLNWVRVDTEKPNVESRSDDIDNFYRLQYQIAF